MTWDHPRGYDPLVAASAKWAAATGVEIEWECRSLQDFESFPVEELARAYDLIVIDHPHVGQLAAESCLLPIDSDETASLGPSLPSYVWGGSRWALPIDAAAQVQAYRPDLIERPSDWSAMLKLAEAGKVAIALRSPHALMSLYTLCGLLGASPVSDGPVFFADVRVAVEAYDRLLQLSRLVDPACFGMDPIAVLEALATDAPAIASPLIYNYVSYAQDDFRPHRLAFADLPSGAALPTGSAVGGTGIAVSALRGDGIDALAFARWVAGEDVQRGLYWQSGGQPAHPTAWANEGANRATHNFYRDTRRTLDLGWLRPRHDGAMAFQHRASARLETGLGDGEPGKAVIAALEAEFAASLPA